MAGLAGVICGLGSRPGVGAPGRLLLSVARGDSPHFVLLGFRVESVYKLLARATCYSPSVSLCCQLSTCLLHTAEHIGKQYCGVSGWRASLGSDGTAGGATAGE